ncbi:MAG: hypothetical protein QOJ66_3771, partial [Ilumatobacteraceae bacterium]
AVHHHENPHSEDASLFRVDDLPTLDKLNLYRQETVAHPGGTA